LGKPGGRAIPVAKDGLIVRFRYLTSFHDMLVFDGESTIAEKIVGIKSEEIMQVPTVGFQRPSPMRPNECFRI
jgi:hypothetical protein